MQTNHVAINTAQEKNELEKNTLEKNALGKNTQEKSVQASHTQSKHSFLLAQEFSVHEKHVQALMQLFSEGATLPFIARYRKEAHGSLDELRISQIQERLQQLVALDERKKSIIASLEERELLTEELSRAIEAAPNLAELEDIYLPYRPKKKTRASVAKEKNLEALALELLSLSKPIDIEQYAQEYITKIQSELSVADALAGASDILAELLCEQQETRQQMRALYREHAVFSSTVRKGQEELGAKYQDFFSWEEKIQKVSGHRVLAVLRAEKESIVRLTAQPSQESAMQILYRLHIPRNSSTIPFLRAALEDGYKRLLAPSMQNELLEFMREKAEKEALHVFQKNLRDLLLAPPMGAKRTLGIDPGLRTGCKLACVNEYGDLLEHGVLYLLSEEQKKSAEQNLRHLVKKHNIEAIAIGNGTAGRETEQFVSSLKLDCLLVLVNESGASVYSASPLARQEFPDLDLTIRGAISIARRLMDPLAELVKIPPQSIGVGQYQHDISPKMLQEGLAEVVSSCVNSVGVNLNTASVSLLSYVSGIGPSLAQQIVHYRESNGAFTERKQLLKVPRLGPKAYQLAAGFLRIVGGKQALDASAVHPESYAIVEKMAKDLGKSITELLKDSSLIKQIPLEKYVSDTAGLPTLLDIIQELEKPGRDPRKSFQNIAFSDSIRSIEDLHEGMILPGIISNITQFGAFVDIGIKENGLIHISQISNEFIRDPHTVLHLGQNVQVRVLGIDMQRKRVSLSMKDVE